MACVETRTFLIKYSFRHIKLKVTVAMISRSIEAKVRE